MQEGTRFHIHARVTWSGVRYDGGECSVRADAEGLVINRKEIPRRELVGAVTEHVGPGDECRVSIVRRERLGNFSTISIDLAGRETALELVRVLGLGWQQSVLSVLVGQPLREFDVAVFLGIAFVVFIASLGMTLKTFATQVNDDVVLAVPSFVITLFVVLLLLRVLFRARITVGIDGVTRRSWRSRKYVPYEKIGEVVTDPRCVALLLRNQEVFPIAGFGSRNHEVTVGELLYRRIWQAHLAHSELCKKPSTIDDVHTLGARAWVRTLRENPQQKAVDYRTPARTLPHLEDAVVDATQPLQVRVGAAIALRAKDGVSAEKQIRAAASASASPELRVLFEKIAEDATEEELAARIETFM